MIMRMFFESGCICLKQFPKPAVLLAEGEMQVHPGDGADAFQQQANVCIICLSESVFMDKKNQKCPKVHKESPKSFLKNIYLAYNMRYMNYLHMATEVKLGKILF